MKKKLLFLAWVCYVTTIHSNRSTAQDFATFSKIMQNVTPLKAVKYLEIPNGFNQDSLSIAEIDDSISHIVARQNSSTLDNINTPINLKKLAYLGKRNPNSLIEFDSFSYHRDMKMIDKDVEIFNYDGFFILIPDNSPQNILNVYFSARAIEILKNKYSEAFTYLIKPNQVVNGYYNMKPYPSNLPIINQLTPIISFDNSPSRIAGSLWNKKLASSPNFSYLGEKLIQNDLIALTSLDYSKGRPQEIYRHHDTLRNYFSYLKEGLIESIIHEFTHHYISNYPAFDAKCAYLFRMRDDSVDVAFDVDAEEAIVLNTVNSYFKLKGGLSNEVRNFYDKKFEEKKKILTSQSDLNKKRFDSLKQLSTQQATTFEQVYLLSIFQKN